MILLILMLLLAPQAAPRHKVNPDAVYPQMPRFCFQHHRRITPRIAERLVRECGALPNPEAGKVGKKECAKDFCGRGDRLPANGCYCP